MIELPQDQIDKIFREAKTQREYWNALYHVAFPDWNNIKKTRGYPKVSKPTGFYLMQKAIDWDSEHLKDKRVNGMKIFSGGLWMNEGFSTDCNLTRDWVIDCSRVKIEYKQ